MNTFCMAFRKRRTQNKRLLQTYTWVTPLRFTAIVVGGAEFSIKTITPKVRRIKCAQSPLHCDWSVSWGFEVVRLSPPHHSPMYLRVFHSIPHVSLGQGILIMAFMFSPKIPSYARCDSQAQSYFRQQGRSLRKPADFSRHGNWLLFMEGRKLIICISPLNWYKWVAEFCTPICRQMEQSNMS